MQERDWKSYALSIFTIAISLAGVGYGSYLVLYVLGSLPAQALGAFFVALLSVNAIFNVAGVYYYLRSFDCRKVPIPKLASFPRVAFVVPARNEKFETVEKTLRSLLAVDYPRNKLAYYLIDNSTKPDERLREFCRKHGVKYSYVENRLRLKSYALNEFLPRIREEFIALFDADDVLTNDQFLKENLGFLLKNPKLASVQTSKQYAPGSLFANTVNAYYSFFYNFVQPVRHWDDSGMWCGSVGIFRKSAAEKAGGFPNSPTEDTAFSFRADLKGMGGAFNPRVYALGEPIESYATFLAQQWRYTIGNTLLVWAYLKNIFSIPLNKQLHYCAQVFSFMYLSYLFVFYALVTLAFVALSLGTTIFASFILIPEFTQVIAFTYMLAIVALVVVGAKLYFGSYRLGLMVLFVNFAVAMTRAKAIIYGLLGIPARFVMTRQNPHTLTPWEALKLTKAEAVLTATLLFFAIISFARLDFISGFWLFWYAWLFSSALVFVWSTDVKRRPHAVPARAGR